MKGQLVIYFPIFPQRWLAATTGNLAEGQLINLGCPPQREIVIHWLSTTAGNLVEGQLVIHFLIFPQVWLAATAARKFENI